MPKFNNDPQIDETQISNENELIEFPDRIVVPQCKVCSSAYRDHVDLWLARGYSMASIQRSLLGAGVEVSIPSISRHRDNHLPMKIAAYREILENNLNTYQQAQAEGAIQMVSGSAFIDVVIAQGFENLLDGTLEIEAKDVIKAIEVKAGMDEKGFVDFQIRLSAQMDGLRQAMEEAFTPDQARAVLERAAEITEARMRGEEPPEGKEVVTMDEFTPELAETGDVPNE